MKGVRKLLLGFVYLGGMIAVGVIVAMHHPENLVGVGGYATGVATGVTAIVWGNIKEHQAAASGPQPSAQ
jgi:hypothetical protein